MSPSTDKPLVSFLLLAYNQVKFIREAVQSALAQTYSPLEIVLSDDCSPDNTFDLMREMALAYKGPHKIVLNRNDKNLGIGQHFNRVMELATGEIIELAAGDDISLPDRTAISTKILQDNPSLMAVSLSLHIFETDPYRDFPKNSGEPRLFQYDIHDYLGKGFTLFAPSRAFRRHTHDFFGPLIPGCPGEDSTNALRCVLHGKVAVSSQVGVLYRQHGNNSSAPGNLRKFSRDLIHQEYLNSLSLAFKGRLISESIHRRLINHVAKLQHRHETLSEMERAKLSFRSYSSRILLSPHFAAREKLSYLRKCL